MPELPEVESVAVALRDHEPSLVGMRIIEVQVLRDTVVQPASALEFSTLVTGARIDSVTRHGKYLILGLAADGIRASRYLVIHLRMTGRVFLVDRDTAPGPHTRLRMLMDSAVALCFDDPRMFGRAWLVDNPDQVTSQLGPDALTVTQEEFVARCRCYHRQLKSLLLDQSFVAGIGNIYADESLFRAGLHPLRNSGDLSEGELVRLHGTITHVLQEAVVAGGANINGVFKAGSFVVAVYGRETKPCPKCGTGIAKIRVSQRGTHYCPCCQPVSVS